MLILTQVHEANLTYVDKHGMPMLLVKIKIDIALLQGTGIAALLA
jgi:hypothetical protein